LEKSREYYTARFVYENEQAESVGYGSERFNTIARFNTGVGLFMAHAALATAHNGTRIHDPEEDAYSATLKCHDANGEIYSLVFGRDEIVLAGYSDGAIRARFETWANTIPALGKEGSEPFRDPASLKMKFT